jgi:hypothetical protein
MDLPVPVCPQKSVGIWFWIFYSSKKEYLMVSMVLTIISAGYSLSEMISVLSMRSFQLTHWPSWPPLLVMYL